MGALKLPRGLIGSQRDGLNGARKDTTGVQMFRNFVDRGVVYFYHRLTF